MYTLANINQQVCPLSSIFSGAVRSVSWTCYWREVSGPRLHQLMELLAPRTTVLGPLHGHAGTFLYWIDLQPRGVPGQGQGDIVLQGVRDWERRPGYKGAHDGSGVGGRAQRRATSGTSNSTQQIGWPAWLWDLYEKQARRVISLPLRRGGVRHGGGASGCTASSSHWGHNHSLWPSAAQILDLKHHHHPLWTCTAIALAVTPHHHHPL